MEKYILHLTSEEKTKSYADYFNNEPAKPAEDRLKELEKPLDPALALMPEDLNDLLKPGYLASEWGWCVLPNGTGYASGIVKMPGVTDEIIDWWFAWHALEPLRYKIWWPTGHYDLQINGEDRKRILDPKVGMKEKNYGVTHEVIEDIGAGIPDRIRIRFKSPEDYGFDTSLLKNSDVKSIIAGVGFVKSTKSPFFVPEIPAMMCHVVREIPGGVELRSRFWLGYDVVDKKPKKKLPSFIKVPAGKPKGLAMHCAREYHNLAAILPGLYEEQKGSLLV